jgi:hypothetical protein
MLSLWISNSRLRVVTCISQQMKLDYQMWPAKDAKYTSRVDSRIVLHIVLNSRLTLVDAFLALILPLSVSDSHRSGDPSSPLRTEIRPQNLKSRDFKKTRIRARFDILQTDSTSP